MLPTLRRLAANPNLQHPTILPHPLHLYRRVLRAHRYKLPREAREVGDKYVKNEFRLHRDVTKPEQLAEFLSEWLIYTNLLEGDTWKEQSLDVEKLDSMNDDQVIQLYELMKASKGDQEGELQGEGRAGGEDEPK